MISLKGKYKFELVENDAVVRSIEFENLITNGALSVVNPFYRDTYLALGAGVVTPPDFGDIALGNEITRQAMFMVASGFYEDQGSRYSVLSKTIDVTGISGAVSEVGLFKRIGSDYTLVSRSLLKDNSGTPITIDVDAEQTLRITYSIYILIPDILGSSTTPSPYGDLEWEMDASRLDIQNYRAYGGFCVGDFERFYASRSSQYFSLHALFQDGSYQSLKITQTYNANNQTCTCIVTIPAGESDRVLIGIPAGSYPGETCYRGTPDIKLKTPFTLPANYDFTLEFTMSWGRA